MASKDPLNRDPNTVRNPGGQTGVARPYAGDRASKQQITGNQVGHANFGFKGYAPGAGRQDPRDPASQEVAKNRIAARGAPGGGGTESGGGILENWFNARATGTDPASEYAMKRGMNAIDDRMSAGGSFNSGVRGQQISDYAANVEAQRMGQLDALAGGASGEHLGRLNMMFNQGMGLASGQAGLSSQYDLGAAGNMDAANRAQQQMFLNKAGVDSQYAQGRLNTLAGAYSAYQSGKGSGS
jgi:hypothetical protein